jgi:hypothetical protein
MDQKRKLQFQKYFLWVTLITLTVIISLHIFFIFGSAGGFSPDEKATLLIPVSMEHRWDHCFSTTGSGCRDDITISNKSDADRFVFEDKNGTPFPFIRDELPYFPDVSKRSSGQSSQILILNNTGDRYIVEVWYFNNKNELAAAEKELAQYLTVNGKISPVNLSFQEEFSNPENSFPFNPESIIDKQYPVTSYENSHTSGYFLVLENPPPGVYPGCFIAYYGTIGPSDLKQQLKHFKVLFISVISPINFWTERGLNLSQ